VDRDKVLEEIEKRLKAEQQTRGDFARAHACPASSADVSDDKEARLVILRPLVEHANKEAGSSARQEAAKLLGERGSSPRRYRNTLVFLAADRARLGELEQAVRQFLAWQSIERDRILLNLDPFQSEQAQKKRGEAEETIKQRIPETYCWLLVPHQDKDHPQIEWSEYRLQGQDSLAVRAAKKLKHEGALLVQWAGTLLKLALDPIPLWRGNHVSLKQLVEDFAQYLYLPRLKDPEALLLNAARDGVASLTWQQETFAYAEGWDEGKQRYRGLRAGQQGSVLLEGLLVKPEVAAAQLAADEAARQASHAAAPQPVPGGVTYPPHTPAPGAQLVVADGGTIVATDERLSPLPPPSPPAQPRRFYGSVSLDAIRTGRDAAQIADEIIQHLTKLVGAKVEITLEIQAELPDGVPEQVVRTVTENCRTLRFRQYGFEEQ
jgi:hypothetical protein